MIYIGHHYIELGPSWFSLFLRRRKNMPRFVGPMNIKQSNVAIHIGRRLIRIW